MPYSWIAWKHFLNRGSLPSDDSSLCHVDINLASTKAVYAMPQPSPCFIMLFVHGVLQSNRKVMLACRDVLADYR